MKNRSVSKKAMVGLLLVLAAPFARAGKRDYPRHLQRAYEICQETLQPTSLVRPPGFDAQKHAKQLEADHRRLKKAFGRRSGKRFLEAHLKTENDPAKMQCLKWWLAESGEASR